MVFNKQVSLSPWLLTRSLADRLRNDSLLRNSVFMMSSTVVTSAIGYLYWVVAARIYSAHDIGLASAFISAMTLTSTFASLGIGSTLVHNLPRREAGYARSLTLIVCIVIGILTSLLGGIIVAIALPYLSSQFATVEYHITYTLIFIVGVALCTVATLLDQTFVAERATGNMAGRNAVFALVKLAIMVLLVQVGALGIFSSWVLALAATVILAGLVLIPHLKRGYRLAMRGIVGEIRPILSSFAGHHFINIGGILPMYLLPVFVSVRLSVTDNAYFYMTWMMGSVFFMVSPSVATALFSEGSHTTSNIMRKARSSVLIISMLLGPILLVFLLGGRYIMSLFGSNYPQHGLSLLMLLTISAVPDAITNIYVSLLRVQGRLRLAALLNLSMAAITLSLAWMLLPMLGIAGAGWAWLIAQSVGSLIVGADILISRIHVPDKTLAKNTSDPVLQEVRMPSLSVEQSYIATEAISLIDTAVLPIVRLLSRDQANREEAISFIETSVLPRVRLPSTKQANREEAISLIETSVSPRVRLPIANQINNVDRTTNSYPRRQLFKKTHLKSSFVEDEVR